MTILWRTEVGSHAWGMAHALSDHDYMEASLCSTRDILRGTHGSASGSHQSKETNADVARHELGVWVEQLAKANFNFVLGLYSPLVVSGNELLVQFRATYAPTKLLASSLRGCVIGCMKDVERAEKLWPDDRDRKVHKKLRTAIRNLKFGCAWMLESDPRFEAVPDDTEENLRKEVDSWGLTFNAAVASSPLAEKPDDAAMRDFLYRARLRQLGEELPR